MVLVLLPVRAVLADPRVRIDLERETHKKVVVAVTDFVLDDSIADLIGIGKEAKKILEKDLVLSEWFTLLQSRSLRIWKGWSSPDRGWTIGVGVS